MPCRFLLLACGLYVSSCSSIASSNNRFAVVPPAAVSLRPITPAVCSRYAAPPTRRRRTRHRPLSGCRRTRVASVAIPLFSSCRPLRSTGVTRLCRHYETIRLLHGRRSAVAGSPTGQAGPMETSHGKVARLPAAAAPTTVLPRLDTGRRVGAHAHPDRPACSGVHFRSVLRLASSFHPTEPRAPAVAVHVRFPTVGVRGGLAPPDLRPCLAHASSLRSSTPRAGRETSFNIIESLSVLLLW